MIQPDFTKKDYIPKGIKVETIPTHELKPQDKVIILGEVFIVQSNFYNEEKYHYSIEMKHEIDDNTFIREHYIIAPHHTKMNRRIVT